MDIKQLQEQLEQLTNIRRQYKPNDLTYKNISHDIMSCKVKLKYVLQEQTKLKEQARKHALWQYTVNQLTPAMQQDIMENIASMD